MGKGICGCESWKWIFIGFLEALFVTWSSEFCDGVQQEEAFRVKGIAESLMVKKDFPTARRIALKAQHLYNDLENVSQMLTVCDVHCAADKKPFRTEMDWYGILQIEEMAFEATIKKQYRKFALQLHPDKNQFPGSESAFKLIMDAQTVLLDKGKRSLHDTKCKAFRSEPAQRYCPPKKATQNSNLTGSNPHHRQSQQPASQRDSFNGQPTFWTACPFCTVRYQYYTEIINKPLVCQSCNKSFIAYERSGQGPPTSSNMNQSSFSQRKNIPNQTASKVELGRRENLSSKPTKTEFCSEKVNFKRQRKQEEESSESCDTGTDSEEDKCPRRCGRNKWYVSFKENLSGDEDFVRGPKKTKESGSFCANEEENGNGMEEDVCQSSLAADVKDDNVLKQEESNGIKDTNNLKGKEKVEVNGCQKNSETRIHLSSDSTSNSTSNPDSYDYHDPDFHDFDKDRDGECFSGGQLWAVYDILDVVPRFYAQIKKVLSPGFNLRITWLEAHPDDQDEIEWVKKGLPVACGKFKYGKSQYTDERLMFSHPIDLEEGDTHQEYDYEFVEILSEYAEGDGAHVAFLGREGMDVFEIPPDELFRFSHMIPSFKLTGDEREAVPKGSLELDPASLPTKVLETANPEDFIE
ncbi:DNAJ heat shock N-terminal domain-containing protein [Salix suchowensis]|nr:DNAJ heat shock N-terminal domain-containing protein [Salix suchowensis]